MIRQICVYCASSPEIAPAYFAAAETLGLALAEREITLVYGGGGTGLMGRMADAVLSKGGRVVGIMPHFMRELEWAHKHVQEFHFVADMHERKRRFLEGTDAVVALPGGCGTLEELLEVITWRRLGLFDKPVIILNTEGYYDPLLQMLERTITEKFFPENLRTLWSVVSQPEEVLPEIERLTTLSF